MQEKINNFISTNEKAIAAARGARTFWRLLAVLVPAAACGYLLYMFDDIIVLGLAVLLGLYALAQLIKGMWLAEATKVAKAKK